MYFDCPHAVWVESAYHVVDDCCQVWYTSRTGESSGGLVYGLLLDWPDSGEVSIQL
jgi:hypothetical protein